MFFKKAKKIKELEQKIEHFENLEIKKAAELEEYIEKKEKEKEKLDNEFIETQLENDRLRKEVELYTETINLAEIGLYEPKYKFTSSLEAKEKLLHCRKRQKDMIKAGTAINRPQEFEYNGSKKEGKKALDSFSKQMLRCFNFETQVIIEKATVKNLEQSKKKINKSFEDINKLNERYTNLTINNRYKLYKLDELEIAYEYALKVEEEKEELRAQREKEKEEKALQKEINTRKKIIDKDIKHYEKIIAELENKLSKAQTETEKEELQKQLHEQETHKEEKAKEKEELDYRQANATAGYVYVISNIGAFGKDVVKIGVTRRLDPLERIKELSSASVPFKFDVHALIFSDNAYKLESDLHKYFNDYRVNKVNLRKEFFRIPIDDIESKLEEYKNLTINFTKEVEADEYYQTLAIEEEEK